MDKLIPYVDELVGMLRSSANFVVAELPAVVQESVAYWTVMAAVTFWTLVVISIGLTLLSIWGFYKGLTGGEWDEDVGYGIGKVSALLCAISYLFLFVYALPHYIMSTTAPKLFLLTKLLDILN